MNNAVLLITGSVKPNPRVFSLSLVNPEERLAHYKSSIGAALRTDKVSAVVFVDNTGCGIDDLEMNLLAEKRGKQFESLSFLGDEAQILKRGKGFGEGEIIDYALQNSSILSNASYFLKLTGRLEIANLSRLIARMNCQNNYFNRQSLRRNDMCDTRFYAMKKDVYEEFFRDLYREVNDPEGLYIEHLFAQVLMGGQINSKCTPLRPYYLGISGSTGHSYNLPVVKHLQKTMYYKFGLMSF